jgi:hypothetical protein
MGLRLFPPGSEKTKTHEVDRRKMTNSEEILREAQDGLSELLKPYQQQLNQRLQMAEFVKKCILCAGRDDFLQLDELLRSKMAETVVAEEGLHGSGEIFERLRTFADDQVERYRIEFIEDLTARAAEAGLPLEVDFPRFTVMTGIEGNVDFGARRTTLNKKVIKSIDPRRIVAGALRIKRELYDSPYDPQAFIDSLYRTYSEMIGKEKSPLGQSVSLQRFYLDHVLSLQTKAFFQDMEKGKYRGYSLDQFAVDLWRYFQAGIGGTSQGLALVLRAGRSNALWLIDSDGQRRQFTGISFQEREA